MTYTTTAGEVTITDCDEAATGELVIPNTIEGNPVTSIGREAFSRCISLTSISIPDSVTSIGDSAFIGCRSLTTIEVDAGNLTYTDTNGVLFNKEETRLYIYPIGKTDAIYTVPDGVTSIGDAAFYKCTSLTSITIPGRVTSIGDGAFDSCTSLTSITIPNGVTSIGEAAFYGCNSLTAVTFLGEAPKIANDAFEKSSPTIYREADAKGWGDTFAGRPVKLITEKP